MINKEQLKEIIEDLMEVRSQLGRFIVSDEEVFREACGYQRGFLAQAGKEKNIQAYHSQPSLAKANNHGQVSSRLPPLINSEKIPSFSAPDNTPTKGQIKFLETRGITIPKNRKEAWQIINNIKNNEN